MNLDNGSVIFRCRLIRNSAGGVINPFKVGAQEIQRVLGIHYNSYKAFSLTYFNNKKISGW